MATEIGIGISTKLDSFTAGKEASQSAYYQLHKKTPEILIVVISTIYIQLEVIKGIRSIIKDVTLVGCSTAGSLTSYGSFRNSVALYAIASDSIRISCSAGHGISKNPRLAGNEVSKQAVSNAENIVRQAFIMFYDGLSGNGTDILRGAQELFGTSFPIIGGSATDDLHFQKTYQYFNNNIYTDSVIGLLIGGNINIGIGKAHGWQPIGRPHKITKAKSNIVKEIDGRKAIELYEEYLGKTINELKREGIAKLGSSYPLGIQLKEKKEYLTRTPLRITDEGYLILTGEIREKEDINLMVSDRNLALEATKKSCIDALKNIKRSRIKFAMVFSDIGRLQLLKRESQSEVKIIKDILGKNVPFFGYYSCGEYAPIDTEDSMGKTHLHNQVISMAVFSE